jgi:K+-sensing histidine kinase KdpD
MKRLSSDYRQIGSHAMLLNKPMNSVISGKAERRLFSTAHRAPGLGLLLLRVVAGIAVVFHPAMALPANLQVGPTILYLFIGVVGILLLVGLWTSAAGTILAVLATSSAFLYPADPWTCIFIGTLGAALALLGPGIWSIDTQLFGWKRWKRFELPGPKS